MILKMHIHSSRLVLAACDDELVGNVYEEGKKILDLSSSFYKGDKVSDDDFFAIAKKCYLINAVGKNTISVLSEEGIISEEDTKKINGVPYVQVVFEQSPEPLS